MGGSSVRTIRHSIVQRAILIAIITLCLAGTASAEIVRTGGSIGIVKNVTMVNPGNQVVPIVTVTPIPCPSGYICMEEAKALEMYGTNGYQIYLVHPCNYNQWKQPMYCYQKKISVIENRNPPVKSILVNDPAGKQLVKVDQPEGVPTMHPDINPVEPEKIPVRKVSGAVINQSLVQPVKVSQAGKIPVQAGGEGDGAQEVPTMEPVKPVSVIDKQTGTQNSGILAFFAGLFGGASEQTPSENNEDQIAKSDAPVSVRSAPEAELAKPKDGIIEEAGKIDQDSQKYTVGSSGGDSILGMLTKIFGWGDSSQQNPPADSDQWLTATVDQTSVNCISPSTAIKFTGFSGNVPTGTTVSLKLFNAPSGSLNDIPADGILIGSATIEPDLSWTYTWNGVVPGYSLKDGQDYLIKAMLTDKKFVKIIIRSNCYDVSTPANSYNSPGSVKYVIAPTIYQGATVFIGEAGLNVAPALLQADGKSPGYGGTPDVTTIGWWHPGGNIGVNPPDKILDLTSNYRNMYISPDSFVGFEGNWYLVNPVTGTVAGNSLVFIVVNPSINIAIQDFSKTGLVASQGADRTNGIVSQGDLLGFLIDTNMYPVLDPRFRSPINHDQRDGYIDIRVQDPSGNIITSVDAINPSTGNPTVQSLLQQNVDKLLYIWGDPTTAPLYPGRWNTGAINSKGEYLYPPGTYRVWAESKLNGMSENYKNAGQKYTFRTITYVYTVTIVPKTP
jgi:hypothetical protein